MDDRAGPPKGSTSNYFRTRRALLDGVVERHLELEAPPVGIAFQPPASMAELVDHLSDLLDVLADERRTETTARYVLFMEASHDAALREALSRARESMADGVVVAMATLRGRPGHGGCRRRRLLRGAAAAPHRPA